MEWKDVDASSFWLFEAEGDSEADSTCPNLVSVAVNGNLDVNDDDDDAHSCSGDSSNCARITEFEDDMDRIVGDGDGYGDDSGEEEEAIDQDWTGLPRKSISSTDSTVEMMNEMEENKLFWETCLAT